MSSRICAAAVLYHQIDQQYGLQGKSKQTIVSSADRNSNGSTLKPKKLLRNSLYDV